MDINKYCNARLNYYSVLCLIIAPQITLSLHRNKVRYVQISSDSNLTWY